MGDEDVNERGMASLDKGRGLRGIELRRGGLEEGGNLKGNCRTNCRTERKKKTFHYVTKGSEIILLSITEKRGARNRHGRIGKRSHEILEHYRDEGEDPCPNLLQVPRKHVQGCSKEKNEEGCLDETLPVRTLGQQQDSGRGELHQEEGEQDRAHLRPSKVAPPAVANNPQPGAGLRGPIAPKEDLAQLYQLVSGLLFGWPPLKAGAEEPQRMEAERPRLMLRRRPVQTREKLVCEEDARRQPDRSREGVFGDRRARRCRGLPAMF